jgi:hypothetical protein
MSRLNKRALYQMALQPTETNSNSSADATIELTQITSANQVPDGRISGKLTASVLQRVEIDDGASVSSRARRLSTGALEGHSRAEIKQKLGAGSLGSLTNAYLEQQLMYDEEIHTVQQRFYGLRAV